MRMSILVACLWLATSPLWGKIVFYSNRVGNLEIYKMDSDGSDLTRLTFNEAIDIAPSWSPNGRQIAFHSYRADDKNPHRGKERNSEIYVMDADGGNPRRLTHHPITDGYPSWSPDGSQIAFDSGRNGGKNKDINIFVMDADGSNIKQITDLGFASRPKWSPDGKRIAFEGFIGANREILVVNADGRGRFQVSQSRRGAHMFLGGWSPNGKQIVYADAVGSSIAKSFPVIATLNLAGRRKVKKWDRVPVPRMLQIYSESFSVDGRSILFTGRKANQSNIYRFRLADHTLIQLTDNPGSDTAAHEWDPRLFITPRWFLPLFWGDIKSDVLRP